MTTKNPTQQQFDYFQEHYYVEEECNCVQYFTLSIIDIDELNETHDFNRLNWIQNDFTDYLTSQKNILELDTNDIIKEDITFEELVDFISNLEIPNITN